MGGTTNEIVNKGSSKSFYIFIVIALILLCLIICIICSSSMSSLFAGSSQNKSEEEEEEGIGLQDNEIDDSNNNSNSDEDDDNILDGDDDNDNDNNNDNDNDNDNSDNNDNKYLVSLYDNKDYGKLLGTFNKTGKYAFEGKYSKLNDDVTSIKIAPGYKVDLFNDKNFKEKLINNLTGNVKDLGKNSNRVASITISKK